MTDYAALNVNPFLKCFMKSEQAVAGHIQGDSSMAAHWLQYVGSLLEGLTLVLHSFSFCSSTLLLPFHLSISL